MIRLSALFVLLAALALVLVAVAVCTAPALLVLAAIGAGGQLLSSPNGAP